jgi:hypothetical protein
MVLFNGLLCASGDSRGCDAVRDSQDLTSGQWFRNPQYFRGGIVDPGHGADFSPDMALGVELYLIQSRDTNAAWKWLIWLDSISPCHNRVLGKCLDIIPPNFCEGSRCPMTPGDAPTLAATIEFLQSNAALPSLKQLPNGVLEGFLGTWAGQYGEVWKFYGGILSNCGYPQHLEATSILLLRKLGIHVLDPDAQFIASASCNNGNGFGNAFYDFLAFGQTDQVLADILASCPGPSQSRQSLPSTWHWETTVADPTWKMPDFWDCIFAARLMGVTVLSPGSSTPNPAASKG